FPPPMVSRLQRWSLSGAPEEIKGISAWAGGSRKKSASVPRSPAPPLSDQKQTGVTSGNSRSRKQTSIQKPAMNWEDVPPPRGNSRPSVNPEETDTVIGDSISIRFRKSRYLRESSKYSQHAAHRVPNVVAFT